jgi:hypothetical protein
MTGTPAPSWSGRMQKPSSRQGGFCASGAPDRHRFGAPAEEE